MSTDLDREVAVLNRTARGAIRVARRTYKSEVVFTDIRFCFAKGDELVPTQKGCVVQDGDLRALIDALQKIAAEL